MRRAEKVQIAIALGGLVLAGLALARQAKADEAKPRRVTLEAGQRYRVTFSIFPPPGHRAEDLLSTQVQGEELLDAVFEPLGATDVDFSVLPQANEIVMTATVPVQVTHTVTLDGEMPLPAGLPPELAPRVVVRSVRGPA